MIVTTFPNPTLTALSALLLRMGVKDFEITVPPQWRRYDIHLPNGIVIQIPYDLALSENLEDFVSQVAERIHGAFLLDSLAS